MERSGGGVLKPSNDTTIGGTSMAVFDALGLKHPDLVFPLIMLCLDMHQSWHICLDMCRFCSFDNWLFELISKNW